MKLQIEFENGRVIDIELELDRAAWNSAVCAALASHTLIEVHDADGRVLAVNPRLIQVVRYDFAEASIVAAPSSEAAAGMPAATGWSSRMRRRLLPRRGGVRL